ncbi:MAG TPA: alpha-ketoglutarate-dependent dioxygenase AlkB [Terriglobales bacterium]|jgi:alkylated DNA repair dioxygenase AlkB|nr:alpha-ketoglutarate-dependent dioxygenase AlkB [Terriglobales bacterium]
MQPTLFELETLPEGFIYQRDFLSDAEESELLRIVEGLDFAPFLFQGYTAKRRIVEYGFEYDFGTRKAAATRGIPEFLFPVRERAAVFAGIEPKQIVEAVVTEYPPGAPIGWHRDVPQFEVVIGLSLASSCRMRLKPYKAGRKIVSIILEPRSIYVMRGAARWDFQHSIPGVDKLRYSITFRTLRAKKAPRQAA